MFHSSHFPSSFYPHESHPGRLHAENRLDLETVLRLRDRGHDLVLDGAWSLGRMCVAGKDPKTGQLMAAANPRGMQGYAAGR
jgi:gamma-glutamyltranspeptidase/glutathione hydrolase